MNGLTKNYFRKLRKRKVSRAQGLVEFAIVLPVLLVLVFVLIEMARLLHAWLAVENGARAGVRYAVTAEYNPEHCGDPASYDGYGKCITEADEPEARVDSIHDAAWAGSSSIVRVGFEEAQPDEASYFNVVVCDPEKLVIPGSTFDTHQCPEGEDPGGPGEQVIVVVEFNHPLLLPGLSAVWPQLRVTARREATVETYRIPPAVGTAPAFDSPTPPPTNTLENPLPPHEFCGWQEFHGTNSWKNPTFFGGWVLERHGYEDGHPLVGEVILKSVLIEQRDKTVPNNKVEFINVGQAGNIVKIPVNSYGVEGKHSYDVKIEGLNIRMPPNCSVYNPPTCDFFRRMILEVWFENELTGSDYRIEGEYFFPGYNETCYENISADYQETEPPPVETTETEETEPPPTEETTEPPPETTEPPTEETPWTPSGPTD